MSAPQQSRSTTCLVSINAVRSRPTTSTGRFPASPSSTGSSSAKGKRAPRIRGGASIPEADGSCGSVVAQGTHGARLHLRLPQERTARESEKGNWAHALLAADLLAGTVTLYSGETKNDEGRMVVLTEECRMLLIELRRGKQPEDFLFTRENGENGQGLPRNLGRAHRSGRRPGPPLS